jgi:hypothetical protein
LTEVRVYGIDAVPVRETVVLLATIVKLGAGDWAIAGNVASSRVSNSVGRANKEWNIPKEYINAGLQCGSFINLNEGMIAMKLWE